MTSALRSHLRPRRQRRRLLAAARRQTMRDICNMRRIQSMSVHAAPDTRQPAPSLFLKGR